LDKKLFTNEKKTMRVRVVCGELLSLPHEVPFARLVAFGITQLLVIACPLHFQHLPSSSSTLQRKDEMMMDEAEV